MNERIVILQEKLKSLNIPAMLVTNIDDVHYLSGFTGSTAYMVVTHDDAVFYTDGRYEAQSALEIDSSINCIIVESYVRFFKEECGKHKKLLLQPSCTVEISARASSGGAGIFLDDVDIIKHMRMRKSREEIELIKRQYALAAGAFKGALEYFRYGEEERTWAALLEYKMKLAGADGASFEIIVASGKRGALPHGVASSKTVEVGEPVIVDFGSRQGYNSDYTRMVYSGSDPEVLAIIEIVRTALLKAADAAKPGATACGLDKIARDYIESKGYGKYFNHSLGHGVGLHIHELPTLNKLSDTVIEEGMVFTIEPGIYLPDKFGVRLEDTVVITESSCDFISSALSEYVYRI